jgi:hypothetical protein
MSDDATRIDGSDDLQNFLGAERRCLAFGPRKLLRFDLSGPIDGQNVFFGQPGKHRPNRGHVLLDRRNLNAAVRCTGRARIASTLTVGSGTGPGILNVFTSGSNVGSVTVTGNVFIGNNNSVGTLNITDGGAVSSGAQVIIGNGIFSQSLPGTGTVVVIGRNPTTMTPLDFERPQYRLLPCESLSRVRENWILDQN